MTHKPDVQKLLALDRSPVAISHFDSPPSGLKPYEGAQVPSGCTFWEKAMEGQSFYTVPADHYNCAIGSYVAKIDLPPERAKELEQTVGFMVQSKYIEMSEVPDIPTLPKTPQYVAYAPVSKAQFKPDVVILSAKPSKVMLIYEAGIRAGVAKALTPTLGRPGCAVVPLTMSSQNITLSFGCLGNRTFTGIPEDEMYVCVPGNKWDDVSKKLSEIVEANQKMGEYYKGQKEKFSDLR